MVGSGCDLELRLGVGDHYLESAGSSRIQGASGSTAQHENDNKQLTIFYSGQICVYDVTETQARAIISTAMQETGNKNSHHHHQQQQQQDQDQHGDQRNGMESSPPQTAPSLPPAMQQLLSPGVSSKRSLECFLQKRKTRIAASPRDNQRHRSPSSP